MALVPEGALLNPSCLTPLSPRNSLNPSYETASDLHGGVRFQAIMDLQTQQLESLEREMKRFGASIEVDAEDTLRSFIVQHCEKLEASLVKQIHKALEDIPPPHSSEGLQLDIASAVSVPPCQKKHARLQRMASADAGMCTNGCESQPANVEAILGTDGSAVDFTKAPYYMDDHRSISLAHGLSSQTVPEVAPRLIKDVIWEIGELEKPETRHSWYSLALERKLAPRSLMMEAVLACKLDAILPNKRPDNFLVHLADLNAFHLVTVLAIVANTGFSAYTYDQSVRKLLSDSPQSLPGWWDSLDLGFSMFFIAELLIRLLAYRLWFFVDEGLWHWNIFDLFLCTLSLISTNADFLFLRMLRIFRIVRMIKVLVQSTALVELRNLLLAVTACVVPLLWAVAFVAIALLVFSMFILQGISSKVDDIRNDPELLAYSKESFYGFDSCFKTLFVVVAGSDWLEPHDVLSQLSPISGMIMPIFVVFMNIGIMNIVIGVFADASSGSKDRHAIASEQIAEVEDFIGDMSDLLSEFVPGCSTIHWSDFKEYFYQEHVQAYLAYHGLDTSHVQLIFSLIDLDKDGTADVREFIIGMLRLKGFASSLNQRVTLHGIKYLADDVAEIHKMHSEIREILRKIEKTETHV